MREWAFRRYVNRLAAGRGAKPRFGRGPAAAALNDEQTEQVRTVIELRAAAAGGGTPSAAFTSQLHLRLASQVEPDPGPPAQKITRRRLVQAGSLAAASALAGAAVEQALAGPDPQIAGPAETLLPNNGTWRTVATSDEVAGGAVCPFDLGAVNGFVQRRDGRLLAVSGVCTHLGCRLVLSAPTSGAELECPCHRAAFSTDGAVIRHQLARPLRPLPRLAVREINGNIQVYAPT